VNLLVLVALVGLLIAGWLAGHVWRYSNPALWHPPIPEMNPQIKTGFEYEGIPRLAVFGKRLTAVENPASQPVRIWPEMGPAKRHDRCTGSAHFTSLPAMCHSAEGRLVRASMPDTNPLILPLR